MKQDKAKLLVAALRSGEYKQARGKLRTESGFCCLGVACDLYRKEIGGNWIGEYYFEFRPENGQEGEENYLPSEVHEWLGVESPNPSIEINCEEIRPACMNDAGMTFAEIADFIEANWEGLK